MVRLPEQIATRRLLLRAPNRADAGAIFRAYAQDLDSTTAIGMIEARVQALCDAENVASCRACFMYARTR
ncbi:MAG: hypothetical protein ABI661_01550 [Gammaproteobacteria bacterium]